MLLDIRTRGHLGRIMTGRESKGVSEVLGFQTADPDQVSYIDV